MVKVKAMRVEKLGGPEVMKLEDVEIGEPKEGEVRMKNKAIGLNFVDVYFRKGVYKVGSLPFTPGSEAIGVVTAVGVGVTDTKVGDVVGYAGQLLGSYAEEQILPANRLVPVPPSLDPNVGAAILAKGMTSRYLLRECWKIEPGQTILVHAAARGDEYILCQWAKSLGLTVIGAVFKKEEAAQAKEDGCHHVIIYSEEDLVARVHQITSGIGVELVYDSLGKDTYKISLACLKHGGSVISFGQSTGPPGPFTSTKDLTSIYLIRPCDMLDNANRDVLLEAAAEVFAKVASGDLNVRLNHTYPLSHAPQAHQDLENGNTTGSIVLLP